MAISAYPRTAVQGTGAGTNKQNGLSLMLLNSTTGEYEAATSSTFAGGGGGGGDATAANQTTQIDAANITNDRLINPSSGETISQLLFSDDASRSIAQLLFDNNSGYSAVELLGFIANLADQIRALLVTANNSLANMENVLVDGTQRTAIIGTNGVAVDVDAGTKSLTTNVVTT